MASSCNVTEEKLLSKSFTKYITWKLALGPSAFIENKAQLILENKAFYARQIYWICNSKTAKICHNHNADVLSVLFLGSSLKMQKGPRNSFKATFWGNLRTSILQSLTITNIIRLIKIYTKSASSNWKLYFSWCNQHFYIFTFLTEMIWTFMPK